MQIVYNKFKKVFETKSRVGFLLNSQNGNFLNLAVAENFSKFNGYFFSDLPNNEFYKVLDEIIPVSASEVESVVDDNCVFVKKHKSFLENCDLSEKRGDDCVTTQDFFVGLSGGLIYEINNYNGELLFDFDIRKKYDFDEWGRNYRVFRESDLVYVEYEKVSSDLSQSYKLFVCLKVPNSSVEFLNEFVEKVYEYDEQRNTDSRRYVFRAFKVDVRESKKVFMGVGFTKEDAYKELKLLEHHSFEMRGIEQSYQTLLVSEKSFKNPISDYDYVAYCVAFKNYFKFFARDFVTDSEYTFAGFPWFFQDWSRDHLIGLKPLINSKQLSKVKQVLFDYLSTISSESPFLGVFKGASTFSVDASFWLFLRLSELLEKSEKLGEFKSLFEQEDLKYIKEKGFLFLEGITVQRFDKSRDLIQPDWAETWMDTVQRDYPVEVQAMFLKFLSFMGDLSEKLGDVEDLEKYRDLERYFLKIVKKSYYRNNNLYDELGFEKVRVNVFLVYYFYPKLLSLHEWELVFDNSIRHLWLDWGGFSSLSKFDAEFEDVYSGEDNLSYHRGDSWLFMNNIAAICCYDLNYRKYKYYVHKILSASKTELLQRGFVGFMCEVSDAREFSSKGCLAQFWSQATFVEFLDLFYRKR